MRNQEDMTRIIAALLEEAGKTEAEQEQTRKLAAKLMEKHGLTEEDVKKKDRDMLRADLEIGRHEWIMAKYFGSAIAKLTGTQSWRQDLRASTGRRSDRKKWTFAGYRPDVEQADWLMKTLLEAGTRGAKAYKGDRAKSDFLASFAAVVMRRVNELTEELETVRETSGSTDLVVVKEANVNSYVADELGVRLATGRTRGRGLQDASASAAGRKAGAEVSLRRPVGGSGPKMIGR